RRGPAVSGPRRCDRRAMGGTRPRLELALQRPERAHRPAVVPRERLGDLGPRWCGRRPGERRPARRDRERRLRWGPLLGRQRARALARRGAVAPQLDADEPGRSRLRRRRSRQHRPGASRPRTRRPERKRSSPPRAPPRAPQRNDGRRPPAATRAPGGDVCHGAPAVGQRDGKTWLFVADACGTGVDTLAGRGLVPAWQDAAPGTSPDAAGGILWLYDASGGGLRARNPTTGAVL